MKVRNLSAVVRWPVAIGLFITSAWLLVSTARMSGGDDQFITAGIRCLFGLASLIAGAVLIAPELAEWAAIPINHVLGNIFFPGYSEDPPADYRLARHYRKEGRYEEAIQQYFHILGYHPEELLAYLEGMETAFEGGTPNIANDLCRKGLRSLSSPEAHKQVQRIFDSLREEYST